MIGYLIGLAVGMIYSILKDEGRDVEANVFIFFVTLFLSAFYFFVVYA